MFLIPSSCAAYCQIQVKFSSNKYPPGVAFIRHPSPIRIPTLAESHETWCPVYGSHSTVSLSLHSLELFHIHYYLLSQADTSFWEGFGSHVSLSPQSSARYMVSFEKYLLTVEEIGSNIIN